MQRLLLISITARPILLCNSIAWLYKHTDKTDHGVNYIDLVVRFSKGLAKDS